MDGKELLEHQDDLRRSKRSAGMWSLVWSVAGFVWLGVLLQAWPDLPFFQRIVMMALTGVNFGMVCRCWHTIGECDALLGIGDGLQTLIEAKHREEAQP